MERTDSNKVRKALEMLGFPPNEEMEEQFQVMLMALDVYEARSHSYGEVWKQYGALSNLLSVARKADRLMECWWHNPDGAAALSKDTLDDAYDLLNYAAFFIRNASAGNMNGSPPDRPTGTVVQLFAAEDPDNPVAEYRQ
jgi:hypothetical protein